MLVAMHHLAAGRTNRQIAEATGLNLGAIRSLLSECCEILSVKSRDELAEIARRHY
ncbi:MAG: hypothetical protein AB7N24_14565 [Dehalococcoidia bacterium]